MSAHYSKFDLNTYKGTRYFQSQIPADYPLEDVLVRCRAFRRLPPNLRKLSTLSKDWANKRQPAGAGNTGHWGGIDQWYDDEGYELDPFTGRRLTDEEIDAQWDQYSNASKMKKFKVEDIPIPEGGFADPDTWEEPEPEPDEEDPDAPTEESLVRDIKSHGREYVAKDYGVPLEDGTSDEELAHMILGGMKS